MITYGVWLVLTQEDKARVNYDFEPVHKIGYFSTLEKASEQLERIAKQENLLHEKDLATATNAVAQTDEMPKHLESKLDAQPSFVGQGNQEQPTN